LYFSNQKIQFRLINKVCSIQKEKKSKKKKKQKMASNRARDTHTYNSYQYHEGQGKSTHVRRNTGYTDQMAPLETRDARLDRETELYNKQSQGSPLSTRPAQQNFGLATQVRNQVPNPNIVGTDVRSTLKDALANAHGVSRPQDFPAYQPTPATGVAKVVHHADTPLFVPKLDPSPARRLHQLSDEYLQKIWAEDQRKDQCAERMENNTVGSPINTLRRGDAHGDILEHSGKRQLKNITELDTQPEKVHGRAHNPNHLKSNIQLSTDPVKPVLSGRRKLEPGPSKASYF
jgi:hypothetical protein